MSKSNQSLLARFAVLVSVFALLMVVAVAVTNKDDGGGGGGSSSEGATVPIALTEFKLTPAAISVPEGGKIEVTNNGTVAHNVAITGTDLKTKDIDPKGKETLDISSLKAGDYEIFCAIVGHKDSGMVGKLTVTAAGSGGSHSTDTSASGSSSSSGGDGLAAHADINSLTSPTDPIAKKLNAAMEKSMDAGVAEFLAFTKKYAAGKVKSGNQIIEPKVLADGTKRFNVTAAVTDWEVTPDKTVKAWTYNGTVPGPWIKVNPGDKVEVVLKNQLPISTDIHWHGISVPNDQDGVAGITQDYIRPGTSYTYKWTAPDKPELAMWHAHMDGSVAVLNGLFAVVQVGEPEMPPAGTYGHMDVPANLKPSQEIPMVLNDAGVIGLTLNGKGFPETAPIAANKGDWIMIHYYNEGLVGHPMHLHRQPQLVIAKDGFPLKAPYQMDTLWVAPGERYTVLVHATEPGVWAYHCHILNHAENDAGLTGMVTAMVVNDPDAKPAN